MTDVEVNIIIYELLVRGFSLLYVTLYCTSNFTIISSYTSLYLSNKELLPLHYSLSNVSPYCAV